MSQRSLILLSGCGNRDGSEIHECVCAMLALDQAGFDTAFTAPDMEQAVTISHLTGSPAPARNVLEEAARFARGRIRPVADISVSDFDILVIPGGMGAALTLCDYALRGDGRGYEVEPSVRALVTSAWKASKPIGAMCIAPMVLAACLPGVTVTLGSECDAAVHARAMGAKTLECSATDAVVDEDFRVVTTPAYMVARRVSEIHQGASRMVEELESLL